MRERERRKIPFCVYLSRRSERHFIFIFHKSHSTLESTRQRKKERNKNNIVKEDEEAAAVAAAAKAGKFSFNLKSIQWCASVENYYDLFQ
jgi:hypothetical protein